MKFVAGLWDRKELGWASLIAVFLGAVLLLSVYGCVGEGGVSGGLPIGESELKVTVAIPLTAPQAVALDGVGDSVADIVWNDLPVGTAVRGAVRGGVAGGVRAAGASGVQTGVRAAPADPRRNHLPGHGDGSVATDTGTTSAGAEKVLFSFEATFTVPVKSASVGTGALQTRVRSRTKPDVTYLELKVKVDVKASATDPARVEIVAQDVGFNQVELPDLDGDGVATLFEVVSKGVDAAMSATDIPEASSLQSKLDSLKAGFEKSMKETGFTTAFEIGQVDLTPPETTLSAAVAGPSGSASPVDSGQSIGSGQAITFAFKCDPDEAGCVFRCSLAGPADAFDYKVCLSPLVLSPSAGSGQALSKDGEYTLSVKAADAFGNTDLSPATFTFTVLPAAVCGNGTCESTGRETTATCAADCPPADTTPPDTALSASVASGFTPDVLSPDVKSGATLSKTQVTFSFSCFEPVGAPFTGASSDAGVKPAATCTFSCQLDTGTRAPCTSPVTLTVSEGSHTYTVTAADKAGNKDSTPATFTWKVDTAAPLTAITKQPSAISGQPSASFEFSCSDSVAAPLTGASSDAGVKPAPTCTYYCQIDIGVPVTCSSPHSIAGPLSDGSHTFLVYAQDAAGNKDASPSSVTWLVDTTAPDTALSAVSGPSSVVSGQVTGRTDMTFTLSSPDVAATFQCSLDAASFATCASPVASTSLTAGSHSFAVRAMDAAGNIDATPATIAWTIDLTAPETAITTQPSAVSNQQSAYIEFNSPEVGATFQCALDTAGFATCSSPYSQAALPAGPHTFKVRAVDAVGNADATPAEVTWTIDTTAPTFAGAATATADSATQITVTWTAATDAVTASSAMVYKICASTTSGSCATNFVVSATAVGGVTTYSATALSAATAYYVVVRAQDQAGNIDANVIEKTATTSAPPPPPAGVAQAMTAGLGHTCALATDGTIRCWGNNASGELGDGTTVNRTSPIAVTNLLSAVAVNAGNGGHTCALMSDGAAKCWGDNSFGELGDGTTIKRSTPVPVTSLSNSIALGPGVGTHTCALASDGTVRCWGNNADGQLGDGTTTSRSSPVSVSSFTGGVGLAVGFDHTCALLSSGTIKCWGKNLAGQLGDGTTVGKSAPVAVSVLSNAVAVAGGYSHTCSLLSDGAVRCWGGNGWGQLGDGTTTSKTVPSAVTTLVGAISISAGYYHSCALMSGGTAKCWGINGDGRIGDGTSGNSATPVVVIALADLVSVVAGATHSCGLISNGTAKCWGNNSYGQLGDGTTANRLTPTAVTSLTGPLGVKLPRLHESTASGAPARPWREGIAAGCAHNCALLSNGTVKCWGFNQDGELGNGTTVTQYTPVAVSGLSGSTGITAGCYHNCALMPDSTAKCWGDNRNGQLGNGNATGPQTCGPFACSYTPIPVSGLSGVNVIAGMHYYATCALMVDGTVKCWGQNAYGQLGDGSTVNKLTPVAVSSLTGVVAMATGTIHACALLSDGTVRCWGYNLKGQLGDGSTSDQTSPVAVSSLTGVIAISASDGHTCALVSDGTAKCWGDNSGAQLGDGTTSGKTTPVTVSSLTGAVAVTAGYRHTCAVISDGTARCWGYNSDGELGNGTTVTPLIPVAVSTLTGVVALTAGQDSTCALLSTGTVKCWGYNSNGQIGDGTTVNRLTPVAVTNLP